MGARELEMDQSAAWGIEALQGDALRAMLRELAGRMDPPATGCKNAAIAAAQETRLLDQYRKDPFGFRERIEREARRERAQMVGGWLSQIFG
jgi:hypothetical protein